MAKYKTRPFPFRVRVNCGRMILQSEIVALYAHVVVVWHMMKCQPGFMAQPLTGDFERTE